ncbi:MAG: hypothetical protein U9R60_05940 [Bacteroidota bacterium]|nr:hypothetical protein [Bacteroidota bacterium]
MNFLGVRTFEFTDYANDSINAPAFFSAGRVKRDILKSSTLGLTFADKSWDGGYARSLSADYVLNLGKTWKLTGQYVGSAPGNWLPNSAWFVRFARENNVYHYHIRYSDIGERFMDNVNQTGFVHDDDRREIDIDLIYKWWLQSNVIRYIRAFSNYSVFWSHEAYLRGQNVLSASYNFTKDLWIQVFAQNNTAVQRFYVYGKFGWRFKPPFGAVYLVYTRDEILLPSDISKSQEDILYLKVTYPIVFDFNR